MAISSTLRSLVAKRDGNMCAYCQTTEDNCGLRMHVDHIIPESAGGLTTPDNLCLVCFACNIYKAAHYEVVEPLSGKYVRLFNPFSQSWLSHFAWDESKINIVGLTPVGRATIETLRMNNETVVKARKRWVSGGWHPPRSSAA